MKRMRTSLVETSIKSCSRTKTRSTQMVRAAKRTSPLYDHQLPLQHLPAAVPNPRRGVRCDVYQVGSVRRWEAGGVSTEVWRFDQPGRKSGHLSDEQRPQAEETDAAHGQGALQSHQRRRTPR